MNRGGKQHCTAPKVERRLEGITTVQTVNEPLSAILKKTLSESGAPAVAGIVVNHDSVIAQGAMGVRRLGDDASITMHDRFHTGSNAKAMTAAACAALVGAGSLSWDTTPLDVFPELAGRILPPYETVTLEMLLRHTAGIPPYTDDEAEDFVLPDWKDTPADQQIAFFSKWLLQERPPINEPGTQFSYSNAGVSVAAAMAEAVSGLAWKDLLQRHLFAPLGIDALAGGGWPALHDPDQPWGHWIREGNLVPHPPDDDYQPELFLAPAGDICISLPHYARFLQMNLGALQGRDTILPGEGLRHLHNHSNPGPGLGWGVVKLRSMESLGLFSTHAGSAGTFILVAGVSHSRDLAVALATNSGIQEVIALGFKETIAQYAGGA